MFYKKLMLPVLAVIAGAAASAFTVSNQRLLNTADEYYWFQFSEDGQTLLNQTVRPEKTSTDPFGCSGNTLNCAQAFTSIDSTIVGGNKVYTPGTPSSQPIDKKDL